MQVTYLISKSCHCARCRATQPLVRLLEAIAPAPSTASPPHDLPQTSSQKGNVGKRSNKIKPQRQSNSVAATLRFPFIQGTMPGLPVTSMKCPLPSQRACRSRAVCLPTRTFSKGSHQIIHALRNPYFST